MQKILAQLERFGISATQHSHHSLLEHLSGTYKLLKVWNCAEYVCLAGLCHSIYGPESFVRTPATLGNRSFVQGLIGIEAERLAYLFGAHKKESLWQNLNRADEFSIEDRFVSGKVSLSQQDLSNMVTITLANWLEQRPRAEAAFQSLRKNEFQRSKKLLPRKAYDEFLRAYNLVEAE